MIHNWAEGFHVRPRTGVIVEEGATFVSNYILLRPVRSVQAYPRVFLRGAGARAQFNSIMVGLKESLIDMGSYAELTGQGTRVDAISRAVARDRSTMYLRGELVGQHNESRGHLDCRGMLLSEHAKMRAIPELLADSAPQSQLSHEAAVGPIAEEAVEYLMTRGLARDIAISTHAMVPASFLEASSGVIGSLEITARLKVRRLEGTSSTRLELQTVLWALAENRQGPHGSLTIYSDSQSVSDLLKRKPRLVPGKFLSKKTNQELANASLYRVFYEFHDEMGFQVVNLAGHSPSRTRDTVHRIF